jgi:hypothetical protein
MVRRRRIKRMLTIFILSSIPAGGGTINPTLHYPRTHYSIIPLFHHSIGSEAN